jgi:hypothetical protein
LFRCFSLAQPFRAGKGAGKREILRASALSGGRVEAQERREEKPQRLFRTIAVPSPEGLG